MVRSLIRVGPTWSHYDIKRSLIWGIRSLMNMGKSVNERERRGESGLFTSSLVETGRVCMAPLLEKLVLIPPLHAMVFSSFVCFFLCLRSCWNGWWWFGWPTAIDGLHQWRGIWGGSGADQRAGGVRRRRRPPPLLRPARPHQRVGRHPPRPPARSFLLPGKLKCTCNFTLQFLH